MNLPFLFIGGPEIFIVVLLVVMLFGADKIPEIARGLGKGIRQVKDATNDIKREITETSEREGLNTDILSDVKNQVKEVKESIEDLTGPIKRK